MSLRPTGHRIDRKSQAASAEQRTEHDAAFEREDRRKRENGGLIGNTFFSTPMVRANRENSTSCTPRMIAPAAYSMVWMSNPTPEITDRAAQDRN